ncbi:MAG: alpha/beta hydrolase [Sedimentitalea sp.]
MAAPLAGSSAPFFDDVADGPANGAAWWVKTSDGVRIRVGYWPCDNARGTVFLMPGRTEFIEKYGTTAAEFGRRGYAVVTLDWRGQGLADRLFEDRRVGHIGKFLDYQKDVAGALELMEGLDLPGPLHLLGHSMGGAIGLRALMNGLDVQSCVFTGPMWGIRMSPIVRPFGWALPRVAMMVGMGTKLAPSTKYDFYVQANAFDGNMLTTDPDAYALMQRQLATHPDLGLAGPSLVWLRESLSECYALSQMPAPNVPCVTFVGEKEIIVDVPAIHTRMANWPGGALDVVPGAQHEVLLETPALRKRIFDRIEALFTDSGAANVKRA